MSTNTWAVDHPNKRVFDLGNHSTPLIPEGQRTVEYTVAELLNARENIRVAGGATETRRAVTYGVDASGKQAVVLCAAWMQEHDIQRAVLVTEGGQHPWMGDEYGWTLSSDWTYFTPFSNPHVVPDPYTKRGEVPWPPREAQ